MADHEVFTTNHMSLIVWDSSDDYFDGSQLAANFIKLDNHAHDPAVGGGQQIGSTGLADASVVTAKLADNSVTPAKIPDHSITSQELADNAVATSIIQDNAVTTAKIPTGAITGPKIDPNFLPVGSVLIWYRPNSSIGLPTGWEIMDGRLWNTIANDWGVTTGSIPDMRNKFPLGAAITGIGTDPASPPDIGAVNGSHTRTLTHQHSIPGHTHTIAPHLHAISPDGSHKHRFLTTVWSGNTPTGTAYVDAMQRGTAVPGSAGTRQAFYIPDLNRAEYYGENVSAPMEIVGDHTHGGLTGTLSGQVTDASGALTSGDGLNTSQDFRPAHVGLLFLLKVRNV